MEKTEGGPELVSGEIFARFESDSGAAGSGGGFFEGLHKLGSQGAPEKFGFDGQLDYSENPGFTGIQEEVSGSIGVVVD